MGNKFSLNVKPLGFKIALWAFLLIILIAALGFFGVVDLNDRVSDILLVASILFVFVEASVVQIMRRKKQADIVSMLSVIVATVALVSFVFGLLGMPIAVLAPFQGTIVSVLFVLVLVEAIRK